MDYKIGDKVVYPNHGVGMIEQINFGVLNGRTEKYFMVKILASGLKVMVPATNAESVGLAARDSKRRNTQSSELSGKGQAEFASRLETSLQGKFRANANRRTD